MVKSNTLKIDKNSVDLLNLTSKEIITNGLIFAISGKSKTYFNLNKSTNL